MSLLKRIESARPGAGQLPSAPGQPGAPGGAPPTSGPSRIMSQAPVRGKLHGTSTPYSLPVALAVLKLPTGALTAVLGLLLMRGGFVPGLSALDNPAQIIAWAILFGYAQQLFTRLVDDRAHNVLNQVGGQEQPRDPRPPSGSITGNLSASESLDDGPGPSADRSE